MITRTLSVTSSLLFMLIAHQSSLAEDFKTLLEAKNANAGAFNPAPKEIPYRHTVTIQEVNEEGGKVTRYNGRYNIDPFASAGKRITFTDGDNDFSDNSREDIKLINEEYTQSEITDDFWCLSDSDDGFSEILNASDTQVLEENNEFVTLKLGTKTMLQTIFSEDGNDLPRKVRKRMSTKLTLSKPDLTLRNIRMELSKPTTIQILSKIQELKIDVTCQIAPNGIPYVSETMTNVVGTMLGSDFRSEAKTSVSQLELSY